MVQIHLWNLIENHQPLDILEPSDEGKFKIVHTFNINNASNLDIVRKHIFVYLSKLLVDNWSKATICKFCFKKTATREIVDNYTLLECSTCERIYEYDSSLDSIALPVPKYQFLWKDKNVLTHDIPDMDINVSFIEKEFSYDNLKKRIVSDLQEKLEIFSLNPTIQYNDYGQVPSDINLLLYFDFKFLLDKVQTPGKFKYSSIFWPKIEQSPNYVKDNNTFKETQKHLTTDAQVMDNFEKISPTIVLEKELSKIIIQHNQDDNDKLPLLELLHLFTLSDNIPYMSLYISELDERKHKILRSYQHSEILKQWLSGRKRTRYLTAKLVFKDFYITILLSKENGMKIILPTSKTTNVDKKMIEDIIQQIHLHLNFYNISLPPKSINELEFQTIYLDLFKVELPILDIKNLAKIAKCLNPYLIMDQVGDNLTFFYIHDMDNKEMVRIDKFIWKYVKQQVRRDFESYRDELKIQLGDEFNLEGEHLDFIFQNWVRENSDQLANQKFFRPIKNGVFIQIIPGEVFRIYVRGIQTWKQIDEITLFLEKFISLALDPPIFFKNQCKGIKQIKETQQKNIKFSKLLKSNLPQIFVDNYTTHCQNERQPMIFKDKLKYENWLKEQFVLKDDQFEIQGKTYDSRVFSRNAIGLESNKLKQYQEEFNTKNITSIQQKIFRLKRANEQVKEGWKKNELETILFNLGLNTDGNYEEHVKQILRYFFIQKRILDNNLENINPYPNTMIIKQNDKNFYLTCPNTSKKAQDQKQIFMGFLQLDKHPNSASAIGNEKRKWCIPCCTKKVQGKIKERLNDFCFGLIDYEEFLNKDTGQSDYILSQNKFPLPFGRFGKLNKQIHNLMKSNPVPENVNDITSKTYLRLGIPQSSHSFISAVLTAINFHNTEKRTITDVYQVLQEKLTPKLYHSLNSGSLLLPMDTFKANLNLNNENIIFQEIWEYISMPNILLKSGVNIIVFEKIQDDILVVCPENQEIQHFYKENKPSILLYKEGDNMEPIVYIDDNKTNGLHEIKTQSFRDWYVNSCRLQNFPEDWTAKSMMNKTIKYQIVDSFNKVMYLVDKIAMPVIPSGMIYDLPVKKSPPLLSYKDTIEQMPKKYKPKNVILNDDDMVFGIVVQFDLVVPIAPEKYNALNMFPVRNDLDIYDNVNQAILRDIREYDYVDMKMSVLTRELYQRIRYEFSHANQTVDEFFKNNITIQEVTRDELQDYIVPNIRSFCKDITDIHCRNKKIRLPPTLVSKFKTKLENELKYNRQKRQEIINKDISPIIDLFRFVDTKEFRYY